MPGKDTAATLCAYPGIFYNFVLLEYNTKRYMYRSNTCGELRLSDKGKKVTLAGWVQKTANWEE